MSFFNSQGIPEFILGKKRNIADLTITLSTTGVLTSDSDNETWTTRTIRSCAVLFLGLAVIIWQDGEIEAGISGAHSKGVSDGRIPELGDM